MQLLWVSAARLQLINICISIWQSMTASTGLDIDCMRTGAAGPDINYSLILHCICKVQLAALMAKENIHGVFKSPHTHHEIHRIMAWEL